MSRGHHMKLPCMSDLMFKFAFSCRDAALLNATDGCKWPSDVEGEQRIYYRNISGRPKGGDTPAWGFRLGAKDFLHKQIFYET